MHHTVTANSTGAGITGAGTTDTSDRQYLPEFPALPESATADAAACNPGHSQRIRRQRDRGEGVISTAIAVLVVAFLGAAMWVAFNSIWDGAETNIREQVSSIGSTTE